MKKEEETEEDGKERDLAKLIGIIFVGGMGLFWLLLGVSDGFGIPGITIRITSYSLFHICNNSIEK